MMETTALLLNPIKACLGETRPSKGSVTIMIMATTSTRTHSIINRKTAIPIMAITMII
jgi:hypothetical protein